MSKFKQFNGKYAKSVSREAYVKELSQHDHLKDVDHGDVWDHFNKAPETVADIEASEQVPGNVINKKGGKGTTQG